MRTVLLWGRGGYLRLSTNFGLLHALFVATISTFTMEISVLAFVAVTDFYFRTTFTFSYFP